jgi:hypothetical protein
LNLEKREFVMKLKVNVPMFWPKGQAYSNLDNPTVRWYAYVCGVWLEVVEYHWYDSNYPDDPSVEIREVSRIDKPAETAMEESRLEYSGYAVEYDLRQTLLGETTRMRFVRHVIDQVICFGQTKGLVTVTL